LLSKSFQRPNVAKSNERILLWIYLVVFGLFLALYFSISSVMCWCIWSKYLFMFCVWPPMHQGEKVPSWDCVSKNFV